MNIEYQNWKGWKDENFGKFSSRGSRYYSYHIKRAFSNRNDSLSILEIGFGNGEFLGWARDQKHKVIGIETNPILLKCALSNNFEVFENLKLIDKNIKFDLIIGFDIIEHIDKNTLIELILGFKEQLSENGRMIFRFPNTQSPLGFFYQNGDITHENMLGLSKLSQICALCNLHIVSNGSRLPWYRKKIISVIPALIGSIMRITIESVIGYLYLGKRISFEPNELVVIKHKN
jgi:2-polyprenyl-3-methyl-5-hydroxy-6-metoxy-1,4-benzoquinol methylase